MLAVEVEQLVGVIERFGSQHGNDLERNVVLVECVNAAQHAVECSFSSACAPVPVVQERRAIDTHAHVDFVLAEVSAPLRVNQRRVRLVGLHDLPVATMPPEQFGGFFVPFDRHDERFPGVPQKRERLARKSAFRNPAERALKRRVRHPARIGAIRKVAV
jgi:hypothetical protein